MTKNEIAIQEFRKVFNCAQAVISAFSEDLKIDKITASFTHPAWFGTQARDVIYNGKRLDKSVPVHLTSVDFDFPETRPDFD